MHPSPNHIIRRDMGPASFHSPIKRPERFPVRTARDCIRAQPTDVPASPRKWPPIPYIIMLMYHNTPATTANIQFFQLPLRYNFLVPRVYSKYKQYPTFTIHPAVNAIHQTTFVAYMGSAPAITACSCIGVPYTTATLIIGSKFRQPGRPSNLSRTIGPSPFYCYSRKLECPGPSVPRQQRRKRFPTLSKKLRPSNEYPKQSTIRPESAK